jgi:hypothetical protein
VKYQAKQTIVADGIELKAGDVFEDGEIDAGAVESMVRLGHATPLTADQVAAIDPRDVEIKKLREEVAELKNLKKKLAEYEAEDIAAAEAAEKDPALASRETAAAEIKKLREEVAVLKLTPVNVPESPSESESAKPSNKPKK